MYSIANAFRGGFMESDGEILAGDRLRLNQAGNSMHQDPRVLPLPAGENSVCPSGAATAFQLWACQIVFSIQIHPSFRTVRARVAHSRHCQRSMAVLFLEHLQIQLPHDVRWDSAAQRF